MVTAIPTINTAAAIATLRGVASGRSANCAIFLLSR
jgi:hypothetical protein